MVAFSGGADSAFLAWVAHETLGSEGALAMMGRMQAELRLPLVAMSESGKQKLRQVLVADGLLA